MKINSSNYVISAVESLYYPQELELEVAFVGKSNVGKSTLINSLLNRRNLARTSKTPGRTQLVNYFLINEQFYFVDLPGYGFAKAPKSVTSQWGKIIEEYLICERKKVVMVLLDIRRIPNKDDLLLINWLKFYNVDYKIIFTKIDKLSNNQKFKQLTEIKKKFEFENKNVFFHSSLKKIGNEEILEFIENKLNTEAI